MVSPIPHFIDGAEVSGQGGRSAPVFNPATGERSGSVALASAADVDAADVDAAVAAAKRAYPQWAATPPLRRARVLNRILGILETRIDELAAAITAEHGKVPSDAKGEIQRGMEVVEFATAAPQLLKGEVSENVGTRVDSHSLRQPLGIVAGITPFNFPLAVRRPRHARPRGRALLHPAQDDHHALADRHPRGCRLRHAHDALACGSSGTMAGAGRGFSHGFVIIRRRSRVKGHRSIGFGRDRGAVGGCGRAWMGEDMDRRG